MKTPGTDPMMSQQQSIQKNDFGDMITSNRHSANVCHVVIKLLMISSCIV